MTSTGGISVGAALRLRRADFVCGAIIVAVVLLMGLPGISQGGLAWSDAPNHTFDGIFVLEFLRAWPLGHAREWAEQFYLRHPALGLFVYYPPGFAIAEAGVFALLGVSILAARLTVLLFALGASLLMYALGRRWFDRPTGLFAALLLITCPHGVLWLRDVMLEWPATFWLLATVWAYDQLRERATTLRAIVLASSAIMAFLAKQTTAFILPVLAIDAMLRARTPGMLPTSLGRFRRAALVSLGLSAAVAGAYAWATRSVAALPGQLLQPAPDLAYYFVHLPEIIGWPLLPLAIVGTLLGLPRTSGPHRRLLIGWVGVWFVFCAAIAAKEPRYFFFALPPMALATAHWVLSRGRRGPAMVLLALVVITQGAIARYRDAGRLPRYDAAVAELAARPDADLVLVDAVRDGQFVFDAYVNPAARDKLIPLRASKLLYARAARERYGYQQFVQSNQDILDLLQRYGIRYIVIESRLPATPYLEADPPPRQMLRSMLESDPRFKLVKRRPLACGDPAWDKVELRLYEYPSCPPRTSKDITLSFPAMGRDVTLRLP